MKIIVFFFFFILFFSCREKDENLDLKYEVLNQLIQNDEKEKSDFQILYKSYSATKLQIVNLDREKLEDEIIIFNSINLKNDSIFSTKDIDYLVSQTLPYDSKTFDLDEKKIIGQYEIIKESDLIDLKNNYKGAKEYWKKFNKKFGKKCVRTYSEPIFNLKKDICIVKISESCGPLWGGGYTAIYKKTKGKWEIIKTLDQWVS